MRFPSISSSVRRACATATAVIALAGVAAPSANAQSSNPIEAGSSALNYGLTLCLQSGQKTHT
ncbi:esterase [Corynebacterium diphtheriae]|nr:esterase [Corynebacterium diphtheriae]CAB1048967.1 esterase [Corynebacterium diphtheriae]